jgi:Tol biopolymer transport system component/predicted Ser/Thr protein kinase
MPLKRGDKLDQYTIEALIGEGGMGEVYRAHDSKVGRPVALKVSKGDFDDRFRHEAQSLAQLSHPNICTLHDVGHNYLVMEFIEGTPLKGPVPVEKVIEHGGQILDALDAAHRKGIIHRDLKPSNVMLTRHGIKLLDFGIAKQAAVRDPDDDSTETALTEHGQIIGTPAYMAPELFHGKKADARSDLWAFGCVVYEMLSGRKAFEKGPSADDPAPLGVSPGLDELVRKCLARDPDARFQNALDLKYFLGQAMKQQPVAATKPMRWLWAVAAAVVFGALITWAVMRSRSAPASEQVVRAQIPPPEGGQFDISTTMAISPDGRSLAFVGTAPGKRGIWIRPLEGTAARLLSGTERATNPFWSPDGRSVAYLASGSVWRVDVGGGSPVVVCAAPTVRGSVTWGTDGAIIYGTPSGLRRASAFGGTPEPLTTVDSSQGEPSHRSPQLLPGGRILFQVVGTPQQAGIYATSLSNPKEWIRLVATDGGGVYAAGHLLWVRGTTLVAQRLDLERLKLSGDPVPVADPVGTAAPGSVMVAASGTLLIHGRGGGSRQLRWVDRAGKAAGNLGQSIDFTFRLSPDGRRVAFSRRSSTGLDLWMVEVERDAWSRFTLLPGSSSFPVWSPDGRVVMFQAGTPPNLYRKEASGAGTEQRVTESANWQFPQDWSRDGRLVLYHEVAPPELQRDLWVLSVGPDGKPEAGAKARPYLRTRFDESYARFSPEPSPRWVAYTSNESGRSEVYVRAFPEPRGKFQISTGGGRFPAWSPDGRELYYVSPDDKLMATNLKLGADSVVPTTPRELFALVNFRLFYPYAVAPDGKRFLVTALTGGSEPLEMVVNWPALLKQRSGGE